MLGHQRRDERLLACLLLHADLLLVPADLACWWLRAECVELASLPWPRSSAIKACGRRRRLAGAAFGGN
jgi:hypothetical protein